ncbi:MAG: DUF1223 domain-containing protein, partial [Deltaproteobacteria bacterium]|nr:DUF1223 domain-containing protein [Kofleriaceae bacterium]
MRLLACAVAAVACSGAAPRAPGADSDDATVAPSRGAIVVELFTSQGCSSCPPADRLLTALVAGERTRPVIALAFHVDYWNDLGWRDPFSSPLATARQEAYARTLDRGLYTPQLVVNGRAHAVGSRRADVERALAAAVPVPAMAASVDLVGDSVVVRADAPGGTHALLAVFEDDLATDVPAGENRG